MGRSFASVAVGIWLASAAVAIAAIVGYVESIIKLVHLLQYGPPDLGMEVLRIGGIIVPILGAIAGYF